MCTVSLTLMQSRFTPGFIGNISVALDVNGAIAFDIWGRQWTKLLAVLYDGCTVGLYGRKDHLIGGKSPEGIAARVRLQLEIEKLMGIGPTS